MAKRKKSTKVKIERNAKLPSIGNNWPFEGLNVAKSPEDADAFYVDQSEHQAVRTAATRAGKKLGRKFSVRKVKDPGHKHHGEIAVIRLS